MNSGGYSVALRLSEALLNRGLCAAFYKALFYVKGTYRFEPESLPASLRKYTDITYKVKLISPPILDITDRPNVLKVNLKAELFLYFFEYFKFSCEVDLTADATLSYNNADFTFGVDFSALEITEIVFNDALVLPDGEEAKLNRVIADLLRSNYLDTFTQFKISEDTLAFNVPTIPTEKLEINTIDFKTVSAKYLAAGVSLIEHSGGVLSQIEFDGSDDLAVVLPDTTLTEALGFWWENVDPAKKSFPIDATAELEAEALADIFKNPDSAIEELADVALTILAKIMEIGGTIAEAITGISNLRMKFSGTITLKDASPVIKVKRDNKFELSGLSALINLTTSVICDVDNVFEHTNDKTLFTLPTINLDLTLTKGSGKLTLDSVSRKLKAKIENADIHFEFGSTWYHNLTESVLSFITNVLLDIIVYFLPEFEVCPDIFPLSLYGFDLEIDLNELRTTDGAVELAANIEIAQLKSFSAPFPAFIGNKRTQELHRIYCKEVDEIKETNKVAIYSPFDALSKGYDGCGKCLPKFSRR